LRRASYLIDAFRTLDMKLLRCGIAWAALAIASIARAAFSDGLSADERIQCAIALLTAPQVAALNGQVGHDVTLAHQGGVSGFSTAFTSRRTATEKADAGIDRLSERQRQALDSFAARAIADGPSPSQMFAYAPPPTPPPAPPQVLVSAPLGIEVHGDVSLTVGGGSHGSSFYGAGTDLFVTDPSGRFTLGLGFEEIRGRGFFGACGPLDIGPPDLGPPLRDW
jgi:hypothetical protein